MNNDTTSDEQKKPVAPKPAAKLDLDIIEEPEEVLDWLKSNGMPILVGLAIAAGAFAAVSAYKSHKKAAEITAQSQLFNSQTAQQFQEIVTKYPGATAAALAELSLASQQFEEGQFELAKNSFMEFGRKHPDHSLKTAADLGVVQCDEALNKYDDALKGYEQFIKTQTNHFLYAQAVLGKGRCLELQGKFDDAKAVYEDYITSHPRDQWTQRAETALMYVGKSKRAAERAPQVQPTPVAVPAPAVPAPTALVSPPAAPVAPAAPAAK